MIRPSGSGEWLTNHPVVGIMAISALIGAFQADRGLVRVLMGFLISASIFGGVHAAERLAFRRGGPDAERRVRQRASWVLLGGLAIATLAFFVIPAIA